MRILILGASGMLGHQVYTELRHHGLDLRACLRKTYADVQSYDCFRPQDVIGRVDLAQGFEVTRLLNHEKPDVVINCAGVTTRKLGLERPDQVMALNAHLPRLVSEWCETYEARLIHISTDCVFKGGHAPYTEDSATEAQDLYGRSKIEGEIKDSRRTLTLRTSIIGFELGTQTELLEWFLSRTGQSAQGYQNVIYSGVTTNYLARTLCTLILKFPDLSGLYQISSPPISKYALLKLINDRFSLSVALTPETTTSSDKTLLSDRFFLATGLKRPDWNEQIQELSQIFLQRKEERRTYDFR